MSVKHSASRQQAYVSTVYSLYAAKLRTQTSHTHCKNSACSALFKRAAAQQQERCSLLQIEASSALRERSDLQEQVEELLQQLITVADSSDSGKGAGAKGTAGDVDVEDLRRQLAGMKVRACVCIHCMCLQQLLATTSACKAMLADVVAVSSASLRLCYSSIAAGSADAHSIHTALTVLLSLVYGCCALTAAQR
jgi:hypothetical protein